VDDHGGGVPLPSVDDPVDVSDWCQPKGSVLVPVSLGVVCVCGLTGCFFVAVVPPCEREARAAADAVAVVSWRFGGATARGRRRGACLTIRSAGAGPSAAGAEIDTGETLRRVAIVEGTVVEACSGAKT
jgi:hypothetical protein